MAYFHGLTYEFFSVLAWVGASFAALYGLEYAQPLIAELVGAQKNWVSATIAAALIFVVSFVLLSVISHSSSKIVKSSDFKTADKSLGVIFGILRGLMVVGTIFLVYVWANPDKESREETFKKVRMKPLIKFSAKVIKDVLPEKIGKMFSEDIFKNEDADAAFKALNRPEAKKKDPEPKKEEPHGYKESEKRDLEKLIHQL